MRDTSRQERRNVKEARRLLAALNLDGAARPTLTIDGLPVFDVRMAVEAISTLSNKMLPRTISGSATITIDSIAAIKDWLTP